MTFPTHCLLGLLIGKMTGNYTAALIGSVAVDLDHIASYARHGMLRNPRLFWKTATSAVDPYGDQRGFLHNAFAVAAIAIGIGFIHPGIGLTLVLAHGGHLLLDALDGSGVQPFLPWSRWNFRGPIAYASWREGVFAVFLLAVLLSLIRPS